MYRSVLLAAVVGMLLIGVVPTDEVRAVEPGEATITIAAEMTPESTSYLDITDAQFVFNIPGFYPDRDYKDQQFNLYPYVGYPEDGKQSFTVEPGTYTFQELFFDTEKSLGGGDRWWTSGLSCTALAGSPSSTEHIGSHPVGFGKVLPLDGGRDVVGAYAEVTVSDGDSIECVFTNDLVWWNKLGIKKSIVDGWAESDAPFTFDFEMVSPFGVSDLRREYPTEGDRVPFQTRATPHGTYQFTEQPREGFNFVDATCTDAATDLEWGDYTVDHASATVTVTLGESKYDSFDDVYCTFFNEYVYEELGQLTLTVDAIPNSDQEFEFWVFNENGWTVGWEHFLVDNGSGSESRTFVVDPGTYDTGMFADTTGQPTVPPDWELTDMTCVPAATDSTRSLGYMREAVLEADSSMECTFTLTSTLNPDTDDDGVFDDVDNCPLTENADQFDLDNDGIGDVCDLDVDGDGVLNGEDVCPLTVIPDPSIPTAGELGVNRWALIDDDLVFDTTTPNNKVPTRTYSIADTGGCNAEQIADSLGLGLGQYKKGLSTSAMEAWLMLLANQ